MSLFLFCFAKFTGPIMRGRGRWFKSGKAEGFLAQLVRALPLLFFGKYPNPRSGEEWTYNNLLNAMHRQF